MRRTTVCATTSLLVGVLAVACVSTTQQFLEASGTLGTPRSIPTATTLQDGRVILAGGQNAQGMVVPAVDIFTE